ncbi:hypothetical protein SAMN05421767_13121 [Granulicatella balaenopterae]|uniref:Uncharacterized protein n=1 Tax=Granulicatella balaenopterae TaxID=137733 RepID=A0A1H9MYA8_9LACT|nr:hypothetical protein [Granulicatella balaenopterae]SER28083.1 hypothetical protein SAMN05421767_13121 [Granulicatella balaenopterae]
MDNTNFMKGQHHSKLSKDARNIGFPNYMREAYRFPKKATDEQVEMNDLEESVSYEVSVNELEKNLLESDSYVTYREEPAFIATRHEEHHSPLHSEYSVFQSFREQENQSPRQKSHLREWESSMKQVTRQPFKPSVVPSALKGISLKKVETVNYQYLKDQLKQMANDVLLFEEASKLDVDKVDVHVEAAPITEAPVEEPIASITETPVEEPIAPVSETPTAAPAAPIIETPVEEPTAPIIETPTAAPAAPVIKTQTTETESSEISTPTLSEEDELIHDIKVMEELMEPDKTIEEALAEFEATKTVEELIDSPAKASKEQTVQKDDAHNEEQVEDIAKRTDSTQQQASIDTNNTAQSTEKTNIEAQPTHSQSSVLQTKAVETSTGKVLQQVITDTNVEELASNPLPRKQRRAMNRSLSWIMEQEEGKINLPYPYSYSRKELEESMLSSKKY